MVANPVRDLLDRKGLEEHLRELVGTDSASLPTVLTGGVAPQQSEIVSRGSRACGSKVGAQPPPRKTWDQKRGEEECLEGTREETIVSMTEKSRRGGSAAPNTSEERRQEPG